MTNENHTESTSGPDPPIIGGQGGSGIPSTSTSSSGSSTPLNVDQNSTLRSPSPRKSSNIEFLGLGVSEQSSSLPNTVLTPPILVPTPSLTVTTYPHLANYIFGLLQNVNISPTKQSSSSTSTGQHPLSVSSSGESDDESPSPPLTTPTSTSTSSFDNNDNTDTMTLQTPRKQNQTSTVGSVVSGVERDNLVKRIVNLLDNEEEEKVKDVLKPFMGNLAKDEILMDQVCLDCMHRRRDDVEGVPYAPHFTPSRARGSPNPATAHPLRPFTPTRVPSFRNRTPLGRPHSPSPALAHPAPPNPNGPPSSSGHSSSSSPVISPRMLNAKAATFSPTTRVVSNGSSTVAPPPADKASTTPFLPSDPWKDISTSDVPPRSASPFGAIGPTSMSRTNSSIAIATPLFSDKSSPFHSPMGTHTPTFSRTSSYKGVIPDDDDDDEFSPFGKGLPKLHHQVQLPGASALSTDAKPFSPFGNNHQSGYYSNDAFSESSGDQQDYGAGSDEDFAGSGMTPLDVLCSVFTSVPRSELEDALHRSGYDFESAMGYLVSQHAHPRSGASTPQRVSSPRPLLGVGVRGGNAPGYQAPERGYFTQGGRSFRGDLSPGLLPGGGRSPGGNGGKMCRYFLAGECRRSDCRFSHDIDRALCRFWLRGHCAKGPNCEFLHQLPNNLDPDALTSAMSHVEISSDGYARGASPSLYTPTEEFPDLLAGRLGRGAGRFDPSRNRFANAVKRATPGPAPTFQVSGMRQSPLLSTAQISPALSSPSLAPATLVPLPKMSARIKLRPPTLLPTLKTGSQTNDQYMSSRSTAIRLGHARNACLARAADAFRRGDGAAAKRFSREGKALNQRMLNESSEAAQNLVKERRIEAQRAIRERDPNWSDDPTDRLERGKECAGGLGVIMGTASNKKIGEFLSSSERIEALLDLHTLHGNEAQDIAGQFLAELERENFRGLAYIVIGEEKHVASQDPLRGSSKVRLGTSVKQVLAEWGYAWNEHGGVICVDPCRV
uniref:C3H1-type domain-containing protein n=1 Tax=Kwoniella pini CBS 10737 TaxID=1296096 RepID=A0A1B9HZU4_9TREE|nr:uncharacterized protein I206_05566 [Kwoniella pini CBS 10737]OCF48785.1 hypothetical protein I206_05566 [Kwoniella pini CBS 10737]